MSEEIKLTDEQINAIIDEKLQARVAVLDQRETDLAVKNQAADERINAFQEEKDQFDAAKAKFDHAREQFDKVSAEELVKLQKAQNEALTRQEALDQKEINLNVREQDIVSRETLHADASSTHEAKVVDISNATADLEEREKAYALGCEALEVARKEVAAREQEAAKSLDKAKALEATMNEKRDDLSNRELGLKNAQESFEKQQADFYKEQTAISNDNQVKAKLLDEQIKSVQSMKADLEKQKAELASLKTETLKNG